MLKLMGKNILIVPACRVQQSAGWEKVEAGLGEFEASFAFQGGVKAVFQLMQVENIRRRVLELFRRQGRGAPVGGLLLLGEFNF